jgi:hypothetical protein
VRPLNPREVGLLLHLLELAGVRDSADVVSSLRVQEMEDGGMGSLRFVHDGGPAKLGRQVAEFSFDDSDDVPVSAALYVDTEGRLFELDVFKGDFSPVNEIPEL